MTANTRTPKTPPMIRHCRFFRCFSFASEKAYLLSVIYLWASEYQHKKEKPLANLFGATGQYVLDELAYIRFLMDNQKAYRQLIEQELDTLPEAQLALDFKGLGPILVAGCLSEIQDTTRFVTGAKFDRRLKQRRPRTCRDGQAAVAKMAGLWWPRRDSGHVQGLQPYLARERNPHLRYWFVQSAHTLQRYQPDYRRFYWKKYHEAHNQHHKRAIILTARKAVRLIFALLHKGRQACLEEGVLT